MNDLVLMAKAFADPSRVRILNSLRHGELCVCELCDALGITQSTLSTHLRVIRDAGLVSARKQGKWMYYRIAPDAAHSVSTLFQLYSNSLKSDSLIRNDSKNLSQRLAMRDNGACCVGFREKKTCC